MLNSFTNGNLFGTLMQDSGVADAFSGDAFLARMIAFERAWTEALLETGVVAQAEGQTAMGVIDGFVVDKAAVSRATDKDGLPVPELVRQLRVQCPAKAQSAIHTGATSQDVIDTAIILTCLHLLNEFRSRSATLLENISQLDHKFGSKPLMGRTRMQEALPISVQDRLRIWREPLLDQQQNLSDLMSVVGKLQVGGPVGLRDAPEGQANAVVEHVSKSLGLTVGPVWHTDRSAICDVGHWLTKVSGILGKIGQDIALMAQQGIDEIELSGAGGSSAMPHKQNPVRAEVLVALARYVAGQQGILAQTLVHEQERSGAAWTLEWLTLPAMFEATGAALNNAIALTVQIERIGSKN